MKPNEHKTVQGRILKYAQEIGWTFVPREEAEKRRGFGPLASQDRGRSSEQQRNIPPIEERVRSGSLYFDDLLYRKAKEFNPRYMEAEGALLGQFRHIHSDIYGNREFVNLLRNKGKYYCAEEKRELDLVLIDYDEPSKNVYEVTEEFYWHNGHFGNREDVVFLANGIPILVIECKNANKEEAIALAIDQIRRYHGETPEFFVPQQIFTATEAIGFSYGVTWNIVRRNIFNWKSEQIGKLEEKVKTFFAIPHILRFLKDYIVFAEKEEELQKYIMAQHQVTAIERVIKRALDPARRRPYLAHPGQRQNLHHDQVRRPSLQGSRIGQTDHHHYDRPERTGRPDAQKPGIVGAQ